MQLNTSRQILAASKKYQGKDKEALEHIAYLLRMKKAITAGIEASKLDTLLREECFSPSTPDNVNPKYLYSCVDTVLLSKIVKGEIDPREIAWSELRNRGLDADGIWVGFGDDKCDKPFKKKETQTI